MTRGIAGTAAVLLVLIGTVVCAAEQRDYWREIKAHLEAVNEAPSRESTAGQALYAYFEALTPEEMIIAGRQASLEIMEAYGSRRWYGSEIALAWFYLLYPGKTDDLRDVEPLLAEIADAEAPASWRWFLEDILTNAWDREGRLTDAQRREVVGRLFGVLERKDEHEMVRAQAVGGIPRLLAGVQNALPLAPRQEDEELASFGRRYARLAADLVQQKTASPDLLRQALDGLRRVHKASLPGSEAAVQAVREAVRDYRAYPEGLWSKLMWSAIEMDAAPDLSGLLAGARAAAQEKQTVSRLIALQKQVDRRRVRAETPAQSGALPPGLRPTAEARFAEFPENPIVPVDMQPLTRSALDLQGDWLYARGPHMREGRKVPVRLQRTRYRLKILGRKDGETQITTRVRTCYELVSEKPYTWAFWVNSDWTNSLGAFTLFNFEREKTSYMAWVVGQAIRVSDVTTPVDRCVALHEYACARPRPERFATCPLNKLAPRVFGWRAERRHDAVRLELVFESLTRDVDGNLTITVRDPGSADRVTVVYADGEWRLADVPAAQPEPEQPAQQ